MATSKMEKVDKTKMKKQIRTAQSVFKSNIQTYFLFNKKRWDKGNGRDARDLYESKILYILVTLAGDSKASSTEKPSNTA